MPHWIERVADELLKYWGYKSSYNLNGGLSVSGLQHVGRLRGEIVLNDALAKVLREQGYEARHTLVVYTLDAWKGKEAQLKQFENPKEAEAYRDWPLIRVPDPFGCHENWVEHYWEDFGSYLDRFALDVKVVYTHEVYKSDRMKKFITEVIMKKRSDIIRALNKYRKRNPYPSDWIPFDPICDECGRIGRAKTLSISGEKVEYSCECGHVGETSLGNGKLKWRLEWPSLWWFLEVNFEPYGKDHAMPGGSRDSSIDLANNVFKFKPPYGIMNEWVGYVVRGKDMGDMGSSDFIGFTPKEWLKVADPEVLRYYYLVNNPDRRLVVGLDNVYAYVDRFDRAERVYFGAEEFGGSEEEEEVVKRSYELSFVRDPPKSLPFQLPFLHAVALVQTLPGENLLEEAVQRLKYTKVLTRELSEEELSRLRRRLKQALYWLEHYAPERFKVEIVEEVTPELAEHVEMDVSGLLEALVEKLEAISWREDEIKGAMVSIKRKSKKEEREFFKAMYLALFGKPYGPRIAPYMALMPREEVVKRLREISAYIRKKFTEEARTP